MRISKYKHIFNKGYQPSWTTEVFTIHEVRETKPVTHLLKDESGQLIEGGFYQEELLKTKYKDVYLVEKVLQKKGDKLLVKWLGFPSTSNSWIKSSEIV